MKHGSTLFLKLVIGSLGLLIAVILVFVLPTIISLELKGDFDYAPILLFLYVPALPFFVALYQAIKLLALIEKDLAFSQSAVKALRIIKFCAASISGLFLLGMPYVFILADRDDAPGLVALALLILFTSTVIATASGVFHKLFQNAVELKSENDLTV